MKTYCWLCLYRLRRVSAHVEEGENTLIVILSGIADSSIARWFLLCQMLNSKSAWQQMVCISFSYREVRTEQPPSPFISKLALHFQTDHCCKDLLRNSSPLSLWKQDEHPFCGPGELVRLVAVVQYAHTLLSISSIRLCYEAATMFLLLVMTDLMSVDLFCCCTCCKSFWIREVHKLHVVNWSCQLPSSLWAFHFVWVCICVKSGFSSFWFFFFVIFNRNVTFFYLIFWIYCKQMWDYVFLL